jgi:hypothetical protein
MSGHFELEREWLELYRKSGTSFLHHPAWYKAFMLAREPEPDSVLFCAFRVDNCLVAVIPLRNQRKSITKFRTTISYEIWELYYVGDMESCDITVGSGFPVEQLMDVLLADLRQQRGWDMVAMVCCWASSSFNEAVSRCPGSVVKFSRQSKYLTIDGDYERWMERYSKKFLRNLHRKLNNLHAKGNVRFEWITERASLNDAFDHFLQVEDSGWKGNDGTSIAKQSEKLNYYRHLLAGFGESRQVAIHLLWLDHQCIGGQFGIHIGTTLYLLKIGYDERFSSESPGFLLVDNLVKEACRRGDITRISFVTGLGWMDIWKPSEEPVRNAYYFNRTIKGLALGWSMRLYQKLLTWRRATSNEVA